MSRQTGLFGHRPEAAQRKAAMTRIIPGSPADQTQRTRSAAGIFGRIFLLLSAITVLWSLATPLMAYPDEPVHTIKAAAVARGQILPAPGTSYGHGVHVQVPS